MKGIMSDKEGRRRRTASFIYVFCVVECGGRGVGRGAFVRKNKKRTRGRKNGNGRVVVE
jgi:hypothetical protein